MLQRALVRSGIPLAYSQGFNPRPRMSLPLPRSVGVLSDDEMLCAQVSDEIQRDDSAIFELISSQLPAGCTVSKVHLKEGKFKLQAAGACYRFMLQISSINDKLLSNIDRVADFCKEIKPLIVRRQSGKKKAKDVDVSRYLERIRIENESVYFDVLITPEGSVRVDEMLEILELETADLAEPVKRVSVKWVEK